MLQDPAAQAGRTQGKQTWKQRTLIRGRARAIPTETSHDLQSPHTRLPAAPLPRQGRFRRAREPRSLQAPMISEFFPSIRAGQGPAESHSTPGRDRRRLSSDPKCFGAGRNAHPSGSRLGGDASADMAHWETPWHCQPARHWGSLTCRAHSGGLPRDTPTLGTSARTWGLCFYIKGSPMLCKSPVHPVMEQEQIMFLVLHSPSYKG